MTFARAAGPDPALLRPLRRAFWLAALACLGVVVSGGWLVVADADSSGDVHHGVIVGRLARGALELALDRETRVRRESLADRPIDTDAERATQQALSAKLDSLIASTAAEPGRQAAAREIRTSLERWEALVESAPARVPEFDAVRHAFDAFMASEDQADLERIAWDRAVGQIAFGVVLADLALLVGVVLWLRRRALGLAIDLDASRLEVLERLATAGEYRDDDTGRHTHRVGELAARLASALGRPPADVAQIARAAPLHDVGKIGIPDAVLLKPGALTPDELTVMRTHTRLGAEMLAGGRTPLMQVAQQIARSHHEWWDGTGYPDGLAGAAIPFEARVVAVADVVDALSRDRVYRRAWPWEQVVAEIRRKRGTHFDPAVVDVFLTHVAAPWGAATSAEPRAPNATKAPDRHAA